MKKSPPAAFAFVGISLGLSMAVAEPASTGTSKIIIISEQNEASEGVRIFGMSDGNHAPNSKTLTNLGEVEEGDTPRLLHKASLSTSDTCRYKLNRTLDSLEERTQLQICYADLIPISEDTSGELYLRIKRAARRACPELGSVPYSEVRSCRNDAVEEAVFNISDPVLLAEHWSETGNAPYTVPVGDPEPF